VVDRPHQEDDALLEQARIDVERALAARGLLDHHQHQRVHLDLETAAHICPRFGPTAAADTSRARQRAGAASSASAALFSSSGVTALSVILAISRMKSTTLSSNSGARSWAC